MGGSLTVGQFCEIVLGDPPWHLQKLKNLYATPSLALKPTIDDLSATETLIVVWPRPIDTLMSGDFDSHGVQTGWRNDLTDAQADAGAVPGEAYAPQTMLLTLQKVLTDAGCSITGLSPQWTSIAITGTFEAFARVSCSIVSTHPSDWSSSDIAVMRDLGWKPDGSSGMLLAGYGSNRVCVIDDRHSNEPKNGLGLLGLFYGNDIGTPPPTSSAWSAGPVNNLGLGDGGIINLIDPVVLLTDLTSMFYSTLGSLSSHLLWDGSAERLTGAIADLQQYEAWLNLIIQSGLQSSDFSSAPFYTNLTYPLTSLTVKIGSTEVIGSNAVSPGSPEVIFTIPEIQLQPLDISQPVITISEFTLLSDGTSSGGDVT